MTSTKARTDDHKGAALVDHLASQIRDRIISGDIAIGAQLRQSELAENFGVSRTPIREALRQLQSGGLIEVLPNRGAVVRVPTPWEVREAYEVRAELEALAAARAVTRITGQQLDELRRLNQEMFDASEYGAQPTSKSVDHQQRNDDFHTLIVAVAGNSSLMRSINEFNGSFPRSVSAQVILSDERHRENNFHEHQNIVAALSERDRERAATHMRQHVMDTGEALARWYERRSSTVFHG